MENIIARETFLWLTVLTASTFFICVFFCIIIAFFIDTNTCTRYICFIIVFTLKRKGVFDIRNSPEFNYN